MSMLRIAATNDGVFLRSRSRCWCSTCELPGLPAAHVHDDLPTIEKGLGTYLLSHALSFAIIGVYWASDHSLSNHIAGPTPSALAQFALSEVRGVSSLEGDVRSFRWSITAGYLIARW